MFFHCRLWIFILAMDISNGDLTIRAKLENILCMGNILEEIFIVIRIHLIYDEYPFRLM